MQPTAVYPDLEGASVIISGGGSGIGAALTSAFVRQRARVAFIDIAAAPSEALCDSLEAETGNRPLYLKVDLRDVQSLQKSLGVAQEAHGPITTLVSNAAYDERHDLADVTEEYWDDNQAVNLRHVFFTAQAVIPGMIAAGGGSIINFSSISFMLNQGEMPSYSAAKAGIIGLTKGLAGKVGRHNIRVNAVAPGWVMTERQRRLWVTEDGLAAFIERQCIKRPLEVEDLVGPVLFLASSASKMITAQTLIVDGGVL